MSNNITLHYSYEVTAGVHASVTVTGDSATEVRTKLDRVIAELAELANADETLGD